MLNGIGLSICRPNSALQSQAYANSYGKKVLTGLSIAPIAYWPLWDVNPPIANNVSSSGAVLNGSYDTTIALNQVGIGDNNSAILCPGTSTGIVQLYTTALNSLFNGQLGSLSCWIRVLNAAVWTDGVNRRPVHFGVNLSTNRVLVAKQVGSNSIALLYIANNVSKTVAISLSPTTWTHFGLTWSLAADQVIGYMNGVQQGAILTGLGTWAGALASTANRIGSDGTQHWNGYVAHVALWDNVLSAADMTSLATV